MFEKPPPEEKNPSDKSIAATTSWSFTVDPEFIWVAPTDVTYGHVDWSRTMRHCEWNERIQVRTYRIRGVEDIPIINFLIFMHVSKQSKIAL